MSSRVGSSFADAPHWNDDCSIVCRIRSIIQRQRGEAPLAQLSSPLVSNETGRIPLPMQMSDTELNDLFAACLPKLKKTARKMLRNREDSEDALQDGLLLAFRNLRQFQGRSTFSTWLHSIVRNSARMHFRKNYSHPTDSLDLENSDTESKGVDSRCVETRLSPEEICLQQERSEILRRAVEMLPNQHHRLILSFYLQGLGEMETSQELHIGRNALKSQLHRCRRVLTLSLRKSHASRPQQGRN